MGNVIGFAAEHELNLLKLADYLFELARPNVLLIGVPRARFSMAVFTEDEGWSDGKRTTCGTIGCAVGHGPYAGIPKRADEIWVQYAGRVFGIAPHIKEDEWEWCFSDKWAGIDNTPKGAAQRIMWLLDKGLPEDWEDQMDGDSELCYK